MSGSGSLDTGRDGNKRRVELVDDLPSSAVFVTSEECADDDEGDIVKLIVLSSDAEDDKSDFVVSKDELSIGLDDVDEDDSNWLLLIVGTIIDDSIGRVGTILGTS